MYNFHMSRKRKKYKREHVPKFKKRYDFNLQDEYMIEKEKVLQNIHSMLAQLIFKYPNENLKGDWKIQTSGMTFFYDPVYGHQAEIIGTSSLPVSKRLIIHIELLNLIRSGYGILKAVKLCISTLMKQSKSSMSLNNLP